MDFLRKRNLFIIILNIEIGGEYGTLRIIYDYFFINNWKYFDMWVFVIVGDGTILYLFIYSLAYIFAKSSYNSKKTI